MQILVHTLIGRAMKANCVHWHTISCYVAKCTQYCQGYWHKQTFSPFSVVVISSCRGDTHSTDGSRLNKDMVRLAALPSPPCVSEIYIMSTLYLHNMYAFMYYVCMYIYKHVCTCMNAQYLRNGGLNHVQVGRMTPPHITLTVTHTLQH